MKKTPFTSSQAHDLYKLLEPEIELFLEKENIHWPELVADPTAFTEQEAIETSVELFMTAVRKSLAI